MVDILFWATQPGQDSSLRCENQIQLLTKAQHPRENYIFNGFAPARRCPTTSARLPFLTLVIKAPSLPVSVIFPPTTWKKTRWTEHRVPSSVSVFPIHTLFFLSTSKLFTSRLWSRSEWGNDSLLTLRPRSEPASRGMADFLLSVMRPIRWSPSLDGCHVTGCCRESCTEFVEDRRNV